MAKQLMFSDEGRKKILIGIQKLSNTVKITLGPTGRNVILEKGFGNPKITKDGVTVAKEIELPDPFENMGAKLVSEVASKTNSEAGDGTTTATVLAEAIYKEGLKRLSSGVNPIELKRGIDKAVAEAVLNMKKLSEKINGKEDMKRVATISANNDSDLGELISEALSRVGKEGVITVEEGKTAETIVDLTEGLSFDKGYISPYFINNTENLTCELEKPFILFYEKKISSVKVIIPLLEKVASAGKPVLIIAEDVEGESLAALIINKLKGILVSCAVKAPGFGDRRKAMMEDMAVLTGGQLISDDLGIKLENVTLAQLGTCEKVIIEKDKTVIVKGNGNKKEIDKQISKIKTLIETSTSDYDKEKLQERLGKILGKIAVINVGGNTETEIKEKKDRIEDAINATKAALEEGCLTGGGVGYIKAAQNINLLDFKGDEKLGAEIIINALNYPAWQIAENAGYSGSIVVETIKENKGGWGFNAATSKFEDLKKAGIIDPAKVCRLALINASSISGLLLTSETFLTEIKKKGKVIEDAIQ